MRTRMYDAYCAATRTGRGLLFFPFSMRRPLFAALAVMAAAIGIAVLLLPRRLADYEPCRGETVQLSGTVCGLEQKSERGNIVWRMMLSDVRIEKAEQSERAYTQLSVGPAPKQAGDSGSDMAAEAGEKKTGEPDAKYTDMFALGKRERVLCVLNHEPEPDMSARVRVTGKLCPFRGAMNEGEFDLRLYYHILRVEFSLREVEIRAASAPTDRIAASLYHLRKNISNRIDSLFSTRNAAVLKAMLLGEKGLLEEETKELYRGAGIIHILSISGLHLSLLGTGLFSLAGRCRRIPLPIRAVMSVFIIFLYGKMIGMSTSVFRALVMMTLYITSRVIGRTYDILTAAGIAAILLLLDQPLYLLHTGFQFSFGAVLAIGVLLPALPGRALKTIAIPLAALPLSLWSSGSFPVSSLILNLIVIPLMGAVVVSGGGAVLLESLSGAVKPPAVFRWLPRIVGLPAEYILDLYRFLAETSEKIPGHEIVLGRPSAAQTVLYYTMLAAFSVISVRLRMPHMRSRIEAVAAAGAEDASASEDRKETLLRHDSARRGYSRRDTAADMILRRIIEKICLLLRLGDNNKRKKFACLCTAVWLAAAVFVISVRRTPVFEMDFLYVGQGDGIFISCEGRHFLIDGGSSTKQSLAGFTLLPFLHCKGVGRLDGIIFTHDDGDHCSGSLEFLEAAAEKSPQISICAVYLPDIAGESKGENYRRIENLSAQAGIPVRYISRGQRIRTGSLTLDCLHPARGASYEKANEYSMTLLLSRKNSSSATAGGKPGGPASYGAVLSGDEWSEAGGLFTALLTGDLEGQGEADLLQYLDETGLLQEPESPNTLKLPDRQDPERQIAEPLERDIPQQQTAELPGGENPERTTPEKENVAVLKVAHHGSKNATSGEFLERIRPKAAMISAGADNMYGHPGEDLLQRIRTSSSQPVIFRTDLQGEISVQQKRRGGEYQVKTFMEK